MAKKPAAQNVQKTQGQKNEEIRKKAAEGSTKPIPTAADTPPEEKKEVEDRVKVLAAKIAAEEEKRKAELEAKRLEIKKLQEELKAAREAEKSEAKKAKEAKEEAKKLALAERAKKEAEIAAADEAVVKAQKDLEATEEWSLLQMAKEARAAIGPLPKIPKLGGGTSRGGDGSRKKTPNGLTPNMVKVLSSMTDGAERSAAQIAEATGIFKGKRIPQIVELGCLEEMVPEEGQRGKRYVITDKGREELEKALAEEG